MGLVYGAPLVVLMFWRGLGLTPQEALYVVIGYAIAITLFRISDAMDRISRVAERWVAAREKRRRCFGSKEEEVRTSGAGAFAGMVAGGAIGLLFGPVGVVLVCGILGALLGNWAEYEKVKAERRGRG